MANKIRRDDEVVVLAGKDKGKQGKVLKVLIAEGLQSKIVMVSAVGQQSVVEEGLELGAAEYIVKPFTAEELVEILNKV